jgi:hypothetical protein
LSRSAFAPKAAFSKPVDVDLSDLCPNPVFNPPEVMARPELSPIKALPVLRFRSPVLHEQLVQVSLFW